MIFAWDQGTAQYKLPQLEQMLLNKSVDEEIQLQKSA